MLINKEVKNQMKNSIKKDLSIQYPADDAYAFLIDTINNAATLSRLFPEIRSVPTGFLDALTVGSRKIRQADDTDGDTSTPVNGVTKRQIPYAVKKVFWDEWLSNDDVVNNAVRRTSSRQGIGSTQVGITSSSNLETVIVQMVQKQFAMDLQDLAFNGDTDAPAAGGDPDADFLKVLDGFVKKSLAAPTIIDLLADEPTISKMIEIIQFLPERYKSNYGPSVTWFMKQSTHDKLLNDLQSRQTPLGDAIIKDGKIVSVGGYMIEIVAGLSGPYKNPADYSEGHRGWLALTPWSNLTPVLTQDVKYVRTAEGATAAKKDSTYHIIFGYMDAVLKELPGIVVMVGDNL